MLADSSAAEPADAPADASQPLPPNEQRREGSIVSLVPVHELTAETVKPPTDGAFGPSPDNQQPQNDAEPAMLASSPAAHPVDAPANASLPLPPNDQGRDESIASLVPEPGPSSKPAKPPIDSARGSPPSDQQYQSDAVARLLKRLKPDESEPGDLRRAFDARRGPPDERIGGAGERVAFSDGTNPVVPPIRLSAQDGFAGNRRTRRSGLARIAAAVPIVAGASLAWHYYGEEATETIKTRISSLDWSSSAWTTKLSQYVEAGWDEIQSFRASQMAAHDAGSQSRPQTVPPPAVAATSPEPTQRELEAVARDLADLRQGVEQLTATQEQLARNIATRQVAEPSIKHTISVSREQSRSHLSPSPETRPKTIAGWTLLEVTGGAVVLKGPNGVWRARAGDLVPGVGTVDSVVRWGNRWLVATSAGLISTP